MRWYFLVGTLSDGIGMRCQNLSTSARHCVAIAAKYCSENMLISEQKGKKSLFCHANIHVLLLRFQSLFPDAPSTQADAQRQRVALERRLVARRKVADAALADFLPLSPEATSDAAARVDAADQAERAALERELESELAGIENDSKAFETSVQEVLASTQEALGKRSECAREEAVPEAAAAAAQVKRKTTAV